MIVLMYKHAIIFQRMYFPGYSFFWVFSHQLTEFLSRNFLHSLFLFLYIVSQKTSSSICKFVKSLSTYASFSGELSVRAAM